MRTFSYCTLALSLTIGTSIGQDTGKGKAKSPPGPRLTITSPAFPDGSEIPVKYSDSELMPISPKLEWSNVPMGTESFVLLFHDPDVAFNKSAESDVLHWLVWNIPGESRGLPENIPPIAKLPDGTIQGKNQGNVVGYRGPGANAAGPRHHYTFELYALDTKLDLGSEASRTDVIKASNGHVLGKALYVGRFMRPN